MALLAIRINSLQCFATFGTQTYTAAISHSSSICVHWNAAVSVQLCIVTNRCWPAITPVDGSTT